MIAAVNGIAAGAGSVVALGCDFRLLAESATFAFLFTRVGLAGADMGSAYLLPRIVGLGRATELLLLGDKVSAQRAYEIGLATDVVADDALGGEAAKLAQRMAQGPAFAYANTKVLLTRELDMDLGSAIELEAMTQALLMKGEDFSSSTRPGARAANPTGRADERDLQPGGAGGAEGVLARGQGRGHGLSAGPDRRRGDARRSSSTARSARSAPRSGRPAASPPTSSRCSCS